MASPPEAPRPDPFARPRRVPADPRVSRLARERVRHITVVRVFILLMIVGLIAAHLALLFLSRVLSALL